MRCAPLASSGCVASSRAWKARALGSSQQKREFFQCQNPEPERKPSSQAPTDFTGRGLCNYLGRLRRHGDHQVCNQHGPKPEVSLVWDSQLQPEVHIPKIAPATVRKRKIHGNITDERGRAHRRSSDDSAFLSLEGEEEGQSCREGYAVPRSWPADIESLSRSHFVFRTDRSAPSTSSTSTLCMSVWTSQPLTASAKGPLFRSLPTGPRMRKSSLVRLQPCTRNIQKHLGRPPFLLPVLRQVRASRATGTSKRTVRGLRTPLATSVTLR